jgi:PBP1b-binding outer membrane lipoprotein LpoB
MKLNNQYLKNICILLLLSLIIVSCTSAPKQENEDAPETEEANDVDFRNLKTVEQSDDYCNLE